MIALPALESLGFSRFANSAKEIPASPPKRLVYLGFGFGVTQETWYPDLNQTGSEYKLPLGLQPLLESLLASLRSPERQSRD